MDKMFIIQLIISFFVGGLFIAMQTLIAERLPKKIRGTALTVPSTMAIGLLFIGMTKSPADVPEASMMIPVMLGAVYIFLLTYVFLVKKGIVLALLFALVSWFAVAGVVLKFPPSTFLISIVVGCILVYMSYVGVKKLHVDFTLKPFPMKPGIIIVRSVIGGSIVFIAVLLAKTLGNIWGGIFSSFPAVYTSTITIYHFAQGQFAIKGVAKDMFMPGVPGMMLYAWIAALTFPLYGIWIGTLLAYLATFAFYYSWIKWQNLSTNNG